MSYLLQLDFSKIDMSKIGTVGIYIVLLTAVFLVIWKATQQDWRDNFKARREERSIRAKSALDEAERQRAHEDKKIEADLAMERLKTEQVSGIASASHQIAQANATALSQIQILAENIRPAVHFINNNISGLTIPPGVLDEMRKERHVAKKPT